MLTFTNLDFKSLKYHTNKYLTKKESISVLIIGFPIKSNKYDDENDQVHGFSNNHEYRRFTDH